MNLIRAWKSRRKGPSNEDYLSMLFRFKYTCFKELLASNSELLDIMTDIEEILEGHQVFGMSYVRSRSTRAVFHAYRMVKNFNDLSGNRYRALFEILDRVNQKIKEEIGKRKELDLTEIVLPFSRVNKDMMDWVGGKNANLGEIRSRVDLPIPEGFAITTRAFHFFVIQNEDLLDEINRKKVEIDSYNPQTVIDVSEEIQKLIVQTPLPPEVEEAIFSAYDRLVESAQSKDKENGPVGISMRSSAIGEDSELSYAGQYLSVLNVHREKLIQTYKQVVASLYTPRAISYRLNKGIRDEDIAMSVACLKMVRSLASGVMYSRHPFNLLEDHVIINAVWGLGPYAVEGVISPDTYSVTKDANLSLISTGISHKPVQLVSKPEGEVEEIPVPEEKQDAPCLSLEQIRTLAKYALKLERHYKSPQDIEWALDEDGRLLILQTRPLHLENPETVQVPVPDLASHPMLVEKGSVASPGIGCGPAFHVATDEDLMNFPMGAILVARNSSPKYVVVMQKAGAIITDLGSVTEHMATLAREFRVPTLMNTQVATQTIPQGMEITVDAYSGKVYQGRVPELIGIQTHSEPHMKDTPVYQTLRRVADLIIPLNFIDPKSPRFAPQYCETLHDIGRFVHELSYTEMFQISDLVSDNQKGALKLDARLPLDLYVIDLGDGMEEVPKGAKKITPEKITSLPLKALLRGMLREEFSVCQVRPVHFQGFLSVMREQMLTPSITERFGDRSFAIISDKYLNFSSRVGYHYSVLDSYCGNTANKNYITFSFKGGAADDVRRNRRARAIASILKAIDFIVDVKGDRVDARFQKFEQTLTEEKLDLIGRLLQYTRQMDMLMNTEASVDAVIRNFLAGNYTLDLCG